jgi:glycosyltransferase involved in cell wall biosynthesis
VRLLEQQTGVEPVVVVPYPNFFTYVRDVQPSSLVYWNYDDYSLDDSGASIESVDEANLASHAGTILCSSHYQSVRFRERLPKKAHDVFHFPHGTHRSFINPHPSRRPKPDTVCCVGYLSSRYDWNLIHEVVKRLPHVRFYFVGDIVKRGNHGLGGRWVTQLYETLRLNNVIHKQGLRHQESKSYYWDTAVNWMPYKADLAFVRASCPLKLSDGLSSGRPIVSADIVECGLHPNWVTTYTGADEADDRIRTALEASGESSGTERAHAQVAYARRQTWAMRAKGFLDILQRLA